MTARCECDFEGGEHGQFTAAWYRAHRDHHLAAFPDADERTRDDLDRFVRIAEALAKL